MLINYKEGKELICNEEAATLKYHLNQIMS